MSRLALVVTLLLTSTAAPARAGAQEATLPEGAVIESAEVSGLALDRLSPGLRQDLAALAGATLSREHVARLAARIEDEHPDVVAAVRHVVRADGRVRLVFLVARIGEDAGLMTDINARYAVERVEITGIDEALVPRELRDALDALVGNRHDPAEADALARRLEAGFPDYDVTHHVRRGSERGRVRVEFRFRRAEGRRWIPFTPTRSLLVFHEDHRWSGVLDIRVGGGNNQFGIGLVGGSDDDLVEEYSGYWFRFQNREAGTRRLGLTLEAGRFTQDWQPRTLAALTDDPDLPGAYRTRRFVEPSVTFAPAPRVRFTAGVSITELDPVGAGESTSANAARIAVGFDRDWRHASDARQRLEAGYEWRRGTEALESDLTYRRQTGSARFEHRYGRNTIVARFSAGHLTGRAPLFERFTLGDSTTLRGWNKYDLAPAGGDRMFHQSIEYRYRHLAYFVDWGAVAAEGDPLRVRVSTGVGLHGDHYFLTLGFPLNADRVRATFMMGVRF